MPSPDYAGGSIANLMASLALACGGPELPCPPLRELPVARLQGARNLMLVVVDGLGYQTLLQRGRGKLRQHLQGSLTSVFPSTTASAITTFMTGLPPSHHGLTGWHMWMEEVERIMSILPLSARGESRSALNKNGASGPAMVESAVLPGVPPLPNREDLPARFFDHPSLYSRLQRPSTLVAPSSIINSPFNRYHSQGATRIPYQTLGELFATLAGIAGQPGEKFIYGYWPDLDSMSHDQGLRGPGTALVLAAFEAAFDAFVASLAGTDTLLLVTADHGFMDSPPERQLHLEDHPELAACLARPLCGERRVPYCYLKPGAEAAFTAYVAQNLGHAAVAVPREQLFAEGWFGPGPLHPRLASRVGDYVLVMQEDWTLRDLMPGEREHPMVGFHGGVSAAEMTVPLVLVQA